MRKWAEALNELDEGVEVVASIDITDEPDEGVAAMAQLQITYPTATYRWHWCYHDAGQACKIYEGPELPVVS